MAYRRRRKFVRRYRRRFMSKRRGMRKTIRRVVRSMAETKFYVRQHVGVAINNTNAFEEDWGSALPSGTDFDERIGSQIKTKRLSCRFWVTYGPGATPFSSAKVRVLVLYPRPGMSSTKINSYLTATVPGVYAVVEPTLFYVIKDISFSLGCDLSGAVAVPVENPNRPVDKLIKFSLPNRLGYTFNYDATTLYRQPILYICSDIAPANGSVFLTGYTRMSFIDI